MFRHNDEANIILGADMKKNEAEQAIRYLCTVWGNAVGVGPDPRVQPDFTAFMRWMRDNHSGYLEFRTTTSVSDDVERWFDQEFKQTWRN